MPINIYEAAKLTRTIAFLGEGDWSLPSQIAELEAWLNVHGPSLQPSDYVADIGFSVRPDASGGGAVLSCNTMRALVAARIELFFSEYRDVSDESG